MTDQPIPGEGRYVVRRTRIDEVEVDTDDWGLLPGQTEWTHDDIIQLATLNYDWDDASTICEIVGRPIVSRDAELREQCSAYLNLDKMASFYSHLFTVTRCLRDANHRGMHMTVERNGTGFHFGNDHAVCEEIIRPASGGTCPPLSSKYDFNPNWLET
jgi:hypothetical protein